MEMIITKAILQERGNIWAEISSQIQNAIDNNIPSQVDASQQDIAIWLALQMKFETLQVPHTTCRTPNPHDDVHPEGENSVKRQKTSEYEAYVFGESSSGQANEEEQGDDEIPTKQVTQDIMEEVSLTIDEAKLKKIADEIKEILVSLHPRKTTPLVQSCQRDPEAPALSLINQDLLYLKKGSPGPEKIVLSLHKFPVVPDYTETELLWSLSVFIRSSVIWERVHDFQLGIESYQQKVNLTATTMSFLGIKEHEMFSIICEPVHGIIYKNSKKEKRMTTTIVNNSVFRAFFEKQKLSGPNFMDWYRQLRIVLSAEDKLSYLELPIFATPVPVVAGQQVPPETLAAHATWVKGQGNCYNLERLRYPVSLKLAVSLILVSLRKEYDSFVQNYNMHGMGKMVNKLHAMLKLHEQTLPKRDVPAPHAIRAGTVQKKNKNKKLQLTARGNNKGKVKCKLAYAPKPKIPLSPKKKDPAKDSVCRHYGDTGHWKQNCPQYLSELLKTRSYLKELVLQLKPGALSLFMGNGQRAAVEAIGSYDFNKRAKLNLDSSLLWHCRLGHISKKRIEKLQHDGLLNSIDTKSFEKCVSCLSRKMARKPYSHQVERAKDLLGLIHIDVCGPFRIVSRQEASYFVTFTDDFSRYCYVYLLKHKHEVFETFKMFQKEVENQLGKTIKSLRYDRGGEYISQEFLDHLKEHGIIAHRTPPYTPQHNGVSERRNKTILDMVRSIMSQTTLPKSFWDYTLESAARILNIVQTKKVERILYEVWYGQAPKLSYLKVWGCKALVKRDTLTKPDKLEPRSIKCIFVGYPKETMGYSFYYPPENKVFVARNAEFFENSLITQEASRSLEDLELI
ncbi:retrotransposon protein, putative, ty1-copia subclass [Tanacetum coccineum]